MADIITLGETMAVLIAEELGELASCNRFSKGVAGAEMNIAIGVSRLGFDCKYVTRLGQDPFGLYIQNFLQEANLYSDSIILDDDFVTGMYMKSKVESGDPTVYYYRKNSAASHLEPSDLEAIDFVNAKILHLTGITPALSESCYKACHYAIDKAREHGLTVTFDPNVRPALWKTSTEMCRVMNEFIARSDIVLPGISEGQLLSGCEGEQEIADFFLNLGPHTVILKTGETGSSYYTKDGKGTVPSYRVDHVVDTVGAGDAFASGFLTGHLKGLDLAACVQRGNAMGSIIITSKEDNAALPTEDALQAYMEAKAADVIVLD